jgi:hypothetical protein
MTTVMEPPIPTRFPPYLTAHTTLKVDRRFPNFSNTDFAYTLLMAGAAVLSKPAIADSDGITWHVVLTPTDTAPLNTTATPAPYRFVERLTDASLGETYDVGEGRIMVNPDLASLSAGDAITYEEKTLAVIEQSLLTGITADIEHYSIAGRSISKIPRRELLQMRGQFRALVWRQRNPGKATIDVNVVFPAKVIGPFPYAYRWPED